MQRIICHWSEGNHKSNSTDRAAYHLLVESDGKVIGGDHAISDNVSTSDDDYAAHTRGANTGSIGIACCAMMGCQERPFSPGPKPMTKLQWDTIVQAIAELCCFYKIPVTPKTVLGHGEVQAILGITQKGKWDPMVWPWDTSKSRAEVGAALRTQVSAALAKISNNSATVYHADTKDTAYILKSTLLTSDPEIRRIAASDAVLDPPLTSQRIPGIATIQEAINRIALNNPAIPKIDYGAQEKFRGFFGKQTVAAIRAFQAHVGLGVDGVVGDDTLKALDAALSGSSKPKSKIIPTSEFYETQVRVFNRGIPPVAFLQELVAWGESAPDEIFADKATKETDIYASIVGELGPFGDITHRKACMLEAMRVLAGFESSWKWSTGKDTQNPNENSSDTDSAGAYQVSANSMSFGQDLRDLVASHGILKPKQDGLKFQALMKTNHAVAFEYVARLMRHTMRHHGPLHKNRSKFKLELRKPEQSIFPWLSRDAVGEFQQMLGA